MMKIKYKKMVLTRDAGGRHIKKFAVEMKKQTVI